MDAKPGFRIKSLDRFLFEAKRELDRHGNRFLLRPGSNSKEPSGHCIWRRESR
jgi:hypothetical protein